MPSLCLKYDKTSTILKHTGNSVTKKSKFAKIAFEKYVPHKNGG
jgi:hypothetical protein